MTTRHAAHDTIKNYRTTKQHNADQSIDRHSHNDTIHGGLNTVQTLHVQFYCLRGHRKQSLAQHLRLQFSLETNKLKTLRHDQFISQVEAHKRVTVTLDSNLRTWRTHEDRKDHDHEKTDTFQNDCLVLSISGAGFPSQTKMVTVSKTLLIQKV